MSEKTCANCGWGAEGNFSIHDTPDMDGPEVDLCDSCGGSELPTCAAIWRNIARRREMVNNAQQCLKKAGAKYTSALTTLIDSSHTLMTDKDTVIEDVEELFTKFDPYGSGIVPGTGLTADETEELRELSENLFVQRYLELRAKAPTSKEIRAYILKRNQEARL